MTSWYYDLLKELTYVRGQLYDSEKDRVRLMEQSSRLQNALKIIRDDYYADAKKMKEIARDALELEEK